MEKRYFILKKSYLNIDENSFYFSDHGNWKTCEKLEETENPKLMIAYVLESLFEVLIVTITVTIGLFLLVGELNYSFGGILGMYLLLTSIHFFIKRYKIAQFKIPITKIERLYVESAELNIKFTNAKDQQITHKVKLDDEAEVKDLKKYLSEHFNHKYTIA